MDILVMEYKPWLFDASKRTGEGKLQLVFNDAITTPSGKAGYFSPEECMEILRLGSKVAPRQAVTGDGKGGHSYSRRVSDVREVYPGGEFDWVFGKLEKILLEINKLYQFNIDGFIEGAQIYDYREGGYLDWHMDVARGYMSTRKMSMSIQLSDGESYEGGNLEFLDFGKSAPRGIGDLVVFPSYLMHRVTGVTRGVRKSWVSWVHGPPFT